MRLFPDFADIRGQWYVKRALEVAVTGGHPITLTGSPGCGKTLLGESIAGLHLASTRMLRVEDVTRATTGAALAAATTTAAGGVLLLDDLHHLTPDAVDHVWRAWAACTRPPLVVAALRPCPCGWYAASIDARQDCTCAAPAVTRWHQHTAACAAGFQLHLDLEDAARWQQPHVRTGECSAAVRTRIKIARGFGASCGRITARNAGCAPGTLLQELDAPAQQFFAAAEWALHVPPAHGAHALVVARTIADMDRSPTIGPVHLAEALQYRPRRRGAIA